MRSLTQTFGSGGHCTKYSPTWMISLTLSMKEFSLLSSTHSALHAKSPNMHRVHSSPFKSFDLCCSAHFAPSGFHTIRWAFPVKCFFCGHTNRIVKKKEPGFGQSVARLQPSDGIRILWPEVPHECNLITLLLCLPKQCQCKHEYLNLNSLLTVRIFLFCKQTPDYCFVTRFLNP